jgi:hypothetical protein
MQLSLPLVKLVSAAIAVPIISCLIFDPWQTLSKIVIVVTVVLAFLLGVIGTITFRLYMSEKHVSHPQIPERVKEFQKRMLKDIDAKKEKDKEVEEPKLKGQIDIICEEIFDLTVENFLMANIDLDTKSKDELRKDANEEIKEVIENVKLRLSKIDHVEFLTKTVLEKVTKHFEKHRVFLTSDDENAAFMTFGHLKSIETEKVYLNRLSGVLSLHLLPISYSKNGMVKCLVRDILTNFILFPFIEKVSDPDFLNTKVVNMIKKYEKPEGLLEANLPWNKVDIPNQNEIITDEEFSLENIVFLINLANTATDFETVRSVLASIQYQIDTIQCLIRENGENNQPDYSMKERTLEEIFNLDPEQLTNSDWIEVLLELNKSKLICNLKLEEMMLRFNTMSSIEPEINFKSVMGNQVTRKYFNDFLEISGCQSLLGLWGAVEEL